MKIKYPNITQSIYLLLILINCIMAYISGSSKYNENKTIAIFIFLTVGFLVTQVYHKQLAEIGEYQRPTLIERLFKNDPSLPIRAYGWIGILLITLVLLKECLYP